MTNTVRTKILIISDTHSVGLFSPNDPRPFRRPLPKADILLHCGDLSQFGRGREYRSTLAMLKQIDAELKIVIAGNHDLTLDKIWWYGNGYDMRGTNTDHEDAVEMWHGAEAKAAGVTYMEEELRTFTLSNGAKFTIYTSPYQPEYCGFAFPYRRSEDRYNPPSHSTASHHPRNATPIPSFPDVDIVMTHGPPQHRLDAVLSGEHVGCAHLASALARARPRLACFGHIHEGHGAEVVRWRDPATTQPTTQPESEMDWQGPHGDQIDSVRALSAEPVVQGRCAHVDAGGARHGAETVMVNAAIMTVRYTPKNPPWLVELDLARA